MALTVEDGTGKADADAYVSVVAFKAYADGRGLSYGSTADNVLEQKIREATSYIDSRYRYKGMRSNGSQSLEFPRQSLVDWSGMEVTGLPKRVKDACCELALRAIAEPLYADMDRGGKVKSETIGSLSTTYADDAPVGKVWTAAENLLMPYIRDPKKGQLTGPMYGGSSDGYFGLGMHDAPSVQANVQE